MKKIIQNNKKNFLIGGIVVLLIAIILTTSLIGNTYSIGDNITINEVRDIINNKDNSIIYILNTNSNNKYNKKILSYLNDNNIKFRVYDVNKVEEDEYIELLNTFNINKELFDYPAIIYIQDGIMFANIININDLNIVNQFIEDYDLTTIK